MHMKSEGKPKKKGNVEYYNEDKALWRWIPGRISKQCEIYWSESVGNDKFTSTKNLLFHSFLQHYKNGSWGSSIRGVIPVFVCSSQYSVKICILPQKANLCTNDPDDDGDDFLCFLFRILPIVVLSFTTKA